MFRLITIKCILITRITSQPPNIRVYTSNYTNVPVSPLYIPMNYDAKKVCLKTTTHYKNDMRTPQKEPTLRRKGLNVWGWGAKEDGSETDTCVRVYKWNERQITRPHTLQKKTKKS